ncbi:2-oxo acid dehydrogenase subunit E2 [Arthrobacter sp. CAU 1506]|uniref:dihydrolipoamide acetyltransferase family protein n=1 Tax=Arthrobacter sp. CAU 1506 TaxID=2560052 RepID=UPI0010ACABFF|nr:dihydrolipoamide acetyltransferase family protein [Arthrobacter sp. CAU 1506]TJY69910.1 2-oxo acid dehydrogenase subunit E2 [Arthrobacter sp. CAU 1506]
MTRQVFKLPDLGEGLTEAELVNWLVNVGDEIRVDQPVAEVETAKSMVEVPSPYAGTVAVLHGAAGDTLDVGKPLISVDAPGYVHDDAASGSAGSAPQAGEASGNSAQPAAGHPDGEAYRNEERAGIKEPEAAESGSGNVLIGYGTPGGSAGSKRTRKPKTGRVAGSLLGAGAPPSTTGAPLSSAPVVDQASASERVETRVETRGSAPLVISPLVRKLARDGGLRLADIAGTGDDGMILRKDVEAALAGAPVTDRSLLGAGTPVVGGSLLGAGAPPSTTGGSAFGADARTGLDISARTPMKGVRKTVAQAMSRSRTEIPEATVWVDVDATALLQMRADLKRRDPENTPGLLAFIARFVLAGLAKYPELNTRVEGEEIVGFDGVNLGFAAQTDRGLMVPSVRNADKLSARQLDTEIRRLTAVARDGKATPAELTSGTFTLNNYGVFGVDGSAAIINYPEVAILGVGRIIDKPWVVNGELAVRKVTELVLAFDHRVCDGGTAGGFLRYVADAIENPGSVLADL